MQPFWPLLLAYPVPALKCAFDQLPCACQVVLFFKVTVDGNTHAHLSAFSDPPASYQALRRGSVMASDS